MKNWWSQLVTVKYRYRVIAATLTLLGVGVGILIGYATGFQVANSNAFSYTLTLDTDTPYLFIKPLVGVTAPEAYGQEQLAPLLNAVAKIPPTIPPGSLTRYAYYFRDLTTGKWTGINETDQYNPASMLKVAFAVAAYKQEELTPGFFSQPLVYTQAIANLQSQFQLAPPVDLTVGQAYSVPYLLKEMLSDSDNGSKDLLLSAIDPTIIDKMFTDLSITQPTDEDSPDLTISPQDYSRFLRILYYGTYDLSWKDSNAILQLLNQSTFTSGLVSGVPSTVAVAHKFGEYAIETDSQVQGVELSDCGIVYHPQHPYLICVMTEGKDPLVLANFIAKVSQATYTEVDANYK